MPQDYSNGTLFRLLLEHHQAAVDAETKLSSIREKLISAQRELSALKRAKQEN